jgi:hypothetical protein
VAASRLPRGKQLNAAINILEAAGAGLHRDGRVYFTLLTMKAVSKARLAGLISGH